MIKPGGELVVYRGQDGGTLVQLRAVDGTIWLAQAEMAEVYGTSVQNIDQITRHILDDGEVGPATINSELKVRREGSRDVRREVKVYNLDMILAIGYRVSTPGQCSSGSGRRQSCGSTSSRASCWTILV